MSVVRSVCAVMGGYLVFAISAVFLFQAAKRPPGVWPGAGFAAFSIAYGAAFAMLAGWIAVRVAPKAPLVHASVLALLLALIALVSMLAQMNKPSHWSQWAAILLFAPAVLMGGYWGARRRISA
jgi:hypothetical protein